MTAQQHLVHAHQAGGAVLDLVQLVEQRIDRDHRNIIIDVLKADVVTQEAAQLVGVEFAEAILIAVLVCGGLEPEALKLDTSWLTGFVSSHCTGHILLHVPAGPFVVNADNLTLIICLVNRNFDFYPQAFCHIDNSN